MRLIPVLLAASLAAACQARDERAPVFADDEEPGPAPGVALEFDEFIEAAEVAYCGWAARCGGHRDEASCRAGEAFDVRFDIADFASGTYLDFAGASTEYLRRAIDAGRVEYDGEAAATCVASVEARGCEAPWAHVPDAEAQALRAACGRVFRGTVTRYGPCMTAAECGPEAPLCGLDPNSAEECAPGGCRPYAAIGARCGSDGACGPDAFCEFDFNQSPPQQVCAPRQAIGGSCINGERCAADAYCRPDDYVCGALAEAGETCLTWQGSCAPGLTCQNPDDNGLGRCGAVPNRGEPCTYNSGCKRIDDYCDKSGTCRALADAPDGVSCYDVPCSPWEYCDYASGEVCLPRAGLGEACGEVYYPDYRFVACLAGLECSGFELATSVCQAPALPSACPVPTVEADEPAPAQG